MGAYKREHQAKEASAKAAASKSNGGYSTKTKVVSKVKAKPKTNSIKKGATAFFSFFGGVPVGKKGKLKRIKKTYFGDPHAGRLYKSEMAAVVANPRNNPGFKSLDGYRDVLRLRK